MEECNRLMALLMKAAEKVTAAEMRALADDLEMNSESLRDDADDIDAGRDPFE